MFYLLAFIGGLLFPYLTQLIDIGVSYLSNKQVLSSSYVQAEIDSLNPQIEEKESCIGFQYQPEEYYNDEE